MLFLLTACFSDSTKLQSHLVNDVQEMVSSGEETISLSSYGEWKELYMFGPYTPDDMVNESLGMKFRGPSVSMSETHFLLVLVNENESVRYALLPRSVLKADGSGVGHERYINVDYSLNEELAEIIIEYLPW